jgi:putative transposase
MGVLIISDACRGLLESAADVFSHVPATKVRDVSLMLKAIHAQESQKPFRSRRSKIYDRRHVGPLEIDGSLWMGADN